LIIVDDQQQGPCGHSGRSCRHHQDIILNLCTSQDFFTILMRHCPLTPATPGASSALIGISPQATFQEILMHTSYRVSRTRTIVIAALAAVGLAAVAVYAATSSDTTSQEAPAGDYGHRHHHGAAGPFIHALRQLNLSAEQQTQIKSIFAASKPQFQSLGASMRSNAETMAAMSPTDPGYPALLATAKANAAARIQQMSDVKAQIFALLTKAQQEQIPQIIAADKARWQQRHQNSAPAATTATPATAS
jgi:Spy/CpxP family protein refolding chaperone